MNTGEETDFGRIHRKIEVLIIGAGPAGAAAAVFLGKHGIQTMMISRHPGTAETPRAHITNQRTMEALRDAGLEEPCMLHASPPEFIEHSFWLRSMAGEELARTYAWGNDPARMGDYAAASPCRMCDLPQTELEPILIDEARRLGCDVRFHTELITFKQDADGVTAQTVDRRSGETAQFRSQYMIGADGARSRVVEQLGIALTGQHGLGCAINVDCQLDLTEYVKHRRGSLFSVIQPGSSLWAPVAMFRMVRPWTRWLVALIAPPAAGVPEPSQQEIEQRVLELVGIPAIPMKTLSIAKWWINDIVAERYAVGRVFCMGDAVHRHPPTNGLGSNTCVQDAFNLAWKLAMVLRAEAGPGLLESYNAERQPVGRQIVARANKSMRHNQKIWDALGAGLSTTRPSDDNEMMIDSRESHDALRRDIAESRYEYHAHGVEMNRAYESTAVVLDGTELTFQRDPELYYQPSGRPGSPLPHIWLGHRGLGPRVSTLDVAGKRRFVLLIASEGEPWRYAAASVSAHLGVKVEVISIGPFMDYEDLYGRWCEVAGIETNGCILVRPDLYIAWRSNSLVADPTAALEGVMARILTLAPSAGSGARTIPDPGL
jgi:2,4-dichlorophenol 6-monooxygenase